MAKIGNVIYGWPLRYNYMGFIREFSAWDFPFVEKSFVQFVRGADWVRVRSGYGQVYSQGRVQEAFFQGSFLRIFSICGNSLSRRGGFSVKQGFFGFSRGGGFLEISAIPHFY